MFNKRINRDNINTIISNNNIYYKYSILEEFEAGLVLQGWEVRSVRSGKVNINDSYVTLNNGDAFLLGANFTPLITTSIYYTCDPTRARQLLLNQHELNSLYGLIKIKGYTIVSLSLYWKRSWCKMKIGVAKGKREYDKRSNIKNSEWKIEKARIMKKFRY